MSDNFTTDQFDDDPVSVFRNGKFVLVYPDGTEVEEKPKSRKQKILEGLDKIVPKKEK